ncbi:MAG: CHAT domain-containing protein [Bacteroidetes bacterium]|nr:CHAT domain-containing protein [Bacteroidota bacterium]
MTKQIFYFFAFSAYFSISENIILDSLNEVVKIKKEDTTKVISLTSLNKRAYQSGLKDTCLYFARIAGTLSEKLGYKNGEAEALFFLGIYYYDSKKYQEALKNFTLSYDIRILRNDRRNAALTLRQIAKIYEEQRNHSESLKAYLNTVALFESIQDRKGMAATYLSISDFYLNQNIQDEALLNGQKAYDIYNETEDKTGLAKALQKIGYIYITKDNYKEALNCFSQALKIFSDNNNKKGMSLCYNRIGQIYKNLGDFELALKNYSAALEIDTSLNNKQGMASCVSNIGIINRKLGNYSKALKQQFISLKLSGELNSKQGTAAAYNSIGVIYLDQYNYKEARKYLLLSLKVAEDLEDAQGVAGAYNNIGNIYNFENNYQEALKNYSLALNINQSAGNKNWEANNYLNIGDIYSNTGNYSGALENLYKSLAIKQEIGDKSGVTTAYAAIGSVELIMGNISEAKKNGQLSYKIAEEIGEQYDLKNASYLLSNIYKQEGDYPNAKKHLLKILEINNKGILSNFPILSESEQELYFNSVSKDYDAFNSFVLTSHDNILTEFTYNNALTNKGLLLQSFTALRKSILNSSDTALINQYNNWIVLKKQIAKLYSEGKNAKDLEEKSNVAEKELAKNSQLFSHFYKARSLTWKDIKKSLKTKDAAIEFIHFPKTNTNDSLKDIVYCAVIVKPGSKHPEMIELFKAKELEELLGKFNENNREYIETVYGTKDSPNLNLYNLIWKPMEKALSDVSTIYMSPSGLLHKIAFASLNKEPNIYLCDNYKLNIQTSTGKVAQPENFILNETTKVTLFGGIDYSYDMASNDSSAYLAWDYLLGTKTEAEKIAGILNKSNIPVHIFEAKTATENEFKTNASNSTILHIATHGFFFPDPEETENVTAALETKDTKEKAKRTENGFGYWSFIKAKNPLMRSGLVFAGANAVWKQAEQTGSEDGVLTAQEVANIDLQNTDLVVLSACETGLGDIKGSEGVYGLQRSFKMAGAKFLIMSLWQVPDAETEEFMVNFYKNLITTKNIKTAFTQTQTLMRKKFDPFFWAPFVLLE